MYYVTMKITFPIPEIARKERNLHCDVVHITTKWVSRLVLDRSDPDVAIKAYKLQVDSDWLNPNSLGIMSAFSYIENLA